MRRYYLPLATLILLVAAFLRFWQLHQYPPGPHYDEGAYLLMTRSIAFDGARFFPIVEAYQGREVLYMYLNAPLLHLFGDRIYTLHLSSAFINLITVAAAMRLAREMMPGERGKVVSLVVGLVAAVSFPQVFIARQAFRAVTLPMMQALALVFLWHGLRKTRGWGWLVLAGLFAGGAVYTYMASRLFPFWLTVGVLALLWWDRRRWRTRLPQAALFLLSMGLAVLPMAVYALQRPDIFWGRLGEVTQPGESVSLLESIWLHARMFFIEGDPYLRYNIPSRPYFTWVEGLLLLFGAVVVLWRLLRRGERPLTRAAYLLVLLSPLMTLPSIISVGGLPPSHMRSLGMIPLIFLLVGFGAEQGIRLISQHGYPRYLPAVLAVVTLAAGLYTWTLYLGWASRSDLFYETDADLSLAAQWIKEQAEQDERIYLAARDRSHPTVLIERAANITWLGTDTLFVPPEGSSGLYVFPRSAPAPEDWRAWLTAGAVEGVPLGPDGLPAFEAYRMSGDTLPEFLQAVDGVQNPYLALLGAYSAPIPSGTAGELVTLWRVLSAPPEGDLTPLVQLEDANGHLLSRDDVYMTDTNLWESGAVFLVRLPVSVPPGTPPGEYPVRVAWVGRASDRYVSYQTPAGVQAGIWSVVGTVQAVRPQAPPDVDALSVTTPVSATASEGVVFLGAGPLPSSRRPGEPWMLGLTWEAQTDAPRALSYEILLRSEISETPLTARRPLEGRYPTSQWMAGDRWTEYVPLAVPREQPVGEYAVVLRTDEGEWLLGNMAIEGLPRIFEPPPVAISVEANFADQIELSGYSLDLNQGIELELVWQALATMTEDYTIFVHLVDANGTILDQRDQMPRQNSYLTSLWLTGEYVVEQYTFAVNEAASVLRVGLYQHATGERLTLLANRRNIIEIPLELAEDR